MHFSRLCYNDSFECYNGKIQGRLEQFQTKSPTSCVRDFVPRTGLSVMIHNNILSYPNALAIIVALAFSFCPLLRALLATLPK